MKKLRNQEGVSSMTSNLEGRGEQLHQQKKEQLVVIVMGSKSDAEYVGGITKVLEGFDVPYETRVGSAHKSPEHTLSLVREYNDRGNGVVFIAVAGRSNALGGFIDASTVYPVVSAPPYSEKYGGADIFCSLRMPSGIGTTVAGEPETAALAAIKILALNNPVLANKLLARQREMREKIVADDKEIEKSGFKMKI